ncbi:hypothetical protein BC939DRAFT_482557 [Gamsiella multidivaricata]|uniref:uncharacterized protein n=1 Tax=Gamsiella multidivaricata TaxID=101098 RepID=UPI00221FFFBA|nr:uncharacterized protein BC939DRAFT_482557 [Gamsiella multidivaricata]KAI7815814.1 hypothetical protein BC939DRAFT_482557 [Gamsiella multidivaricata]
MKISILISIAAVVVAVADGATPGEDKIPALSPVFNGIEPHFSSVLSRRDDPFDLEADNLLEKRKALVCPGGTGLCSNDRSRCCPLGGRCCPKRGCCGAGKFCVGPGCCPNSQMGCDGKGCCPKNSNCCSLG